MNAKDALRKYREFSTPALLQGLEEFRALSQEERFELLYWHMMLTNNSLSALFKNLQVEVEVDFELETEN